MFKKRRHIIIPKHDQRLRRAEQTTVEVYEHRIKEKTREQVLYYNLFPNFMRRTLFSSWGQAAIAKFYIMFYLSDYVLQFFYPLLSSVSGELQAEEE